LLVGEMRVDVQGLEAWSTECGTIAGELAGPAASVPSLPSGQATSTAVSAGQALIGGTATVMSSRVQGTATQAAEAATAYATHERESAQRLAAVAPGPAVD
jgi:hypothetical protein